jgi:hypothetical protein
MKPFFYTRFASASLAAATLPVYLAAPVQGQTLPVTAPGPVEVTSDKRAEIVLNGVWKFAPSPGLGRASGGRSGAGGRSVSPALGQRRRLAEHRHARHGRVVENLRRR